MAGEGLALGLGFGTGLAKGMSQARAEALRQKEGRRAEKVALAQQFMASNPALAMQILREEGVLGKDVGPEATISLLKNKRLTDLTKIAVNKNLPGAIRVGAGQELAKITGYGNPEEVQTPEQAKAFSDRLIEVQKHVQTLDLEEKKSKNTMERILEQVRGRTEAAQIGTQGRTEAARIGATSRKEVAEIGAGSRIEAARIGAGQPKTEMDRAVSRGDITPEQRKLYNQMRFDPDYAQAESMLKNDVEYTGLLMQGNYSAALQRLRNALQAIKQSRSQQQTVPSPRSITPPAGPPTPQGGKDDYSYLWGE